MAFDFKTATPAASIAAAELLFGAVSQSAANPSIYPASVVKTFMSLNPTITDANSKTALTFAAIASAVNYFEMENAATTNPIHLYARGTDTNIGLHLVPKGSGFVNIEDPTDSTKRIRFDPSGNSASAITTLKSSDTASHTLTFPNATTTLAGLAVAQTFTQNQTITEVAGGSGLTITGATQTTSQPALNLTQTWSAAGVVFTGLKFNVTNTNSAAGSLLADLQVGGSSQFAVSKAGVITGVLGATFTPAINPASISSIQIGWVTNSTGAFTSQFTLDPSGTAFIFTSTNGVVKFSTDSVLGRDAAAIFSFRGSTSTTAAGVSFYSYGASPPAAGAASTARLYADTSGGKVRLMVIFPSGAAQQIAIEP
jgi:hypothetical protein